jgi:hypothetical protein
MGLDMKTADEIRAAVRNSYAREQSLYGVLQAQYRAKNGRPLPEEVARAEILPFVHLAENDALAAFAEYTVFKELKNGADVVALEHFVRQGLRLTTPDEREILMAIDAKGQMFHWGLLLEKSSDIDAVNLFQRIRWGIGKSEVAKMFSGKQTLPTERGYNEVGYFSPSYGFPACFFFSFRSGAFGTDKLTRIVITYLTTFEEWPSDEEIERAFELLKKKFEVAYGEARPLQSMKNAPVQFRQSEMLVWQLATSVLTLSYGLVRDGIVPGVCAPVSVTLGDRKHDPISIPLTR